MKRRGFFKSVAAGAAGVLVGSQEQAVGAAVATIKVDASAIGEQLKPVMEELERVKTMITEHEKAMAMKITNTCGTGSDADFIINTVAENIQQRGVLFQETRGGAGKDTWSQGN